VTSLELAESYMCLANSGVHKKAAFIKQISDSGGNLIYSHRQQPYQAIDESAAYLMTDMLIDTARNGTARKLSSVPYEVAAKTGTVGGSDGNNTDAWSVSYTSENTLCVWYGNLSGKSEQNFSATGGSYPTMLAKYVYRNSAPAKNFFVPESIVEMKIDTLATKEFNKVMLATPHTPAEHQKYELFDAFNAPLEYSPLYELPLTNMSVEPQGENGADISFEALPYFSYKLIRKNLSTGEALEIYNISEEIGLIEYCDETEERGLYSYSLEVYGKYGSLGIAEEKFVLLGI
ncbi:MAG: penicillin-binding transpeptidase domain-containing protein, partial [Clostridia bacterium]|nr:penicillin-binding transpeptidase domain-containing protein [Clostridia bacterium]